MCSNNGNNGCGCGTGSTGAASIWSSSSKKQQKRPRVPKRGPGVAELEKILREQENIDTPDRESNGEGFSFSHHPFHPSALKPHPPPLPPSPPPRRLTIPSPPGPAPHVPPASKSDHLGSTTLPSMTSLYGHCGYSAALGRNGGSSLVLPGQELFPLAISSCKSKSNHNDGMDGSQSDSGNSSSRNLSGESNPIWPHSASIQKRTSQYPPPMMNQFLGNRTPASSGSLPIGLHNHTEPPSNQSSYFNNPTSKALEEHKVAGMNRFHHPPLENSLIPPPTFQVPPPIFSNFNRPKQSSINDSLGGSSFTSANDCYKDAKWGSTLELNSRKLNSETVVHGHANFPPFATHEVYPPPPVHLFQGVLSKGNVLPYQLTEDRTENSNHRSESSGSDYIPFYNFLEVKEPDWGKDAPSANRGLREARRCGIDLSLKL